MFELATLNKFKQTGRYEVYVVYYVLCRHIKPKTWVCIPGQSSKMKYEKYLFGDFLTEDFWQKTSGSDFGLEA